MVLNGENVRTTTYGDLNFIHYPIQNYLYLAVGSSGAKLVKQYNRFNGQIANVVLNLGDGGFIPNQETLVKFVSTNA